MVHSDVVDAGRQLYYRLSLLLRERVEDAAAQEH